MSFVNELFPYLEALSDIDLQRNGWSRKRLKESLTWSKQLVSLDENGKLLGFILFRDVVAAVEIVFLYVVPSERRKGHMQNLLSSLQEQANGREVWLEVSHLNRPAIMFYQRMGYDPVGLRKKYYFDGSDAVLMAKSC